MTETNLETLIRTLVTPLVKHPDAVRITESETDRYHLHPADVGRVIGRQGHVASALRTVVEGMRSKRPNSKKVRLVINDHRH